MLKVTGYVFLALVLIGAGLLLAAPMLMDWAMGRYLGSEGIRAQFRFARPGLSSLVIHSAQMQTQSFELDARNIVVRYNPDSLLERRVAEIVIASLDITMVPTEQAGATIEVPSPWLLLPADRMRVDALRVENSEPAVILTGSFEFDSESADATLLIESPVLPTNLEALLKLDPMGGINVTLTQPGAPTALQVSGVPGGGTISIDGSVNLVDKTFELLAGLVMPGAPTGHLRGTFTGSAPWPVATTLDIDELIADGAFDFALTGNVPDIDGIALAGNLTTSLASGELKFESDQFSLGANAITLGDASYQFGEDSRLDMALKGGVPARSLASGFLSKVEATIQTTANLSLSSEARQATVTGELTTTLVTGRAITLIEMDTAVELVLPAFEIGLLAEAPFSVSRDLKTGTIDASDASLRIRMPELEWLGQRLAVRAGRADIAVLHIDGDTLEIKGRIRTSNAAQALPANFVVGMSLRNLAGTFEVSADHQVARPLLENELPGWISDYDLDSGKLDLSMAGRFRETDGAVLITGKGRVTTSDAIAHYGETVATGIRASLPVSIDGDVWQVGPGKVDIAAVNIGFPLTDVGFNVDTDGIKASISGFSARVLGGQLLIDDIDYDIEKQASQFNAAVADVSLASILALASEDLDGNGTLDGILPVTLGPQGAAISGGKLTAKPPGGYLNYSGSLPGANLGLELAIRALRNFNFDHMNVDVGYVPEGELDLMVRLEGKNPDVEGGRPIHFNLNVSQNVLTLLESLRAAEKMSDRVQQRLSR